MQFSYFHIICHYRKIDCAEFNTRYTVAIFFFIIYTGYVYNLEAGLEAGLAKQSIKFYTPKNRIRLENTPCLIPNSHIPEFLLWQVQGPQKSIEHPNEHFLPRDLDL